MIQHETSNVTQLAQNQHSSFIFRSGAKQISAEYFPVLNFWFFSVKRKEQRIVTYPLHEISNDNFGIILFVDGTACFDDFAAKGELSTFDHANLPSTKPDGERGQKLP